ncbi:MAG: dimethylhistidine N-methyltransferase [Daejeonella sp.]|nr:dimethylhistidine N-methyltransferase [Daejeonella sp.]
MAVYRNQVSEIIMSQTTTNIKTNIEEIVSYIKFKSDVLKGLRSSPKYLDSKYFYDAVGDKLFQQIMRCPEYYPTKCELQILSQQRNNIVRDFFKHAGREFDLIELGAGDALKSTFLLEELVGNNFAFEYFPIDISENVIDLLSKKLPEKIPGLLLTGLNGDYFDMLKKANKLSDRRKIVMFLGANIGNMLPNQAVKFCVQLREHMNPGDLLFVGFDLKKNPQVILDAYNDKQGFTRDFNLNLLTRINNELDADFDLEKFQHYPSYDPEYGSCKSYLVSKCKQSVFIKGNTNQRFHFEEGEVIRMEISHKYDMEQIENMAASSNFKPLNRYVDSKNWFMDALWIAE